jgi:hypothetical protein
MLLLTGVIQLQMHCGRMLRGGMAESESRMHVETAAQMIARDVRAARSIGSGSSADQLVIQMASAPTGVIDGLLKALLPINNGPIVRYRLNGAGCLTRTYGGTELVTRYRLSGLKFSYPDNTSVSFELQAMADAYAPDPYRGALRINQRVFLQNRDM